MLPCPALTYMQIRIVLAGGLTVTLTIFVVWWWVQWWRGYWPLLGWKR